MKRDSSDDASLARGVAAPGPLRTLVLDLWQRTRIDWSFASAGLTDAFRRRHNLGSDERRFVAETVYGMIRHARRVDEAVAAAGARAASGALDLERLLAYLVLEAGLPASDAVRHRPGLDFVAAREVDERLAREADPVRRIARLHSLPDWLARRLIEDLGEDAERLAPALNRRAPMSVRANTLRNDAPQLAEILAAEGIATRAGALSRTALVCETRANLVSLEAFRAGRFEAQDEGSQLIAELVAPPPRQVVVDFCAGAGGKTLAIAAAMQGRGRVVACDVAPKKLRELRRRARRAGVTNLQVVELPADPDAPLPRALAALAGKVARVLVDVPCSGVGALRRNPEAKWRLIPEDPERLAAMGAAIARRALELVAPDGRLIYATCTLLAAENRGVVSALLAEHPELELVPPEAIWGAERAAAVTGREGAYLELYPHVHGTDGFFGAVLRRPPGAGADSSAAG